MMMSKQQTTSEEEAEAPPAFATPPAVKTGTVEDLERRLAMLGGNKNQSARKSVSPTTTTKNLADASPGAEVSPSKQDTAVAPVAVRGGKNALLARIMAAKEKQEAKKVAPPLIAAPVVGTDMLLDFDVPGTENDPPPSYDTNFLKEEPPPAFDVLEQKQQRQNVPPASLPPPSFDSVQLDPPPQLDNILPPPPPLPDGNPMVMTPSAPAATAPMFEDLLGAQGHEITQQNTPNHPPPVPPPPMEAPPVEASDVDESVLNALDPAEREAFLAEQHKILKEIEKKKSNEEASGAVARAMAFDQRSSSAVANVAASYEGGRQVVSSLEMAANTEEAAQLAADAELAEKLQKEEYAIAQERGSRSPRNRTQQQHQQSQQEGGGQTQSWYDWLTGAPAAAPAPPTITATETISQSSPRGLISVQTGEERPRSAANVAGGDSAARTAEPKSMFACVADSINTAATTMTYGFADEDGNIHGVDSSGLLAMPDVSRQRKN